MADCLEQMRKHLTDIISKSNYKNYEGSIKKMDQMITQLEDLYPKFENLANKSKKLTSFQRRRQKLSPPNNQCYFLINYRKSQVKKKYIFFLLL